MRNARDARIPRARRRHGERIRRRDGIRIDRSRAGDTRLLLALPGRRVRLIEVEARIAAPVEVGGSLFQVRACPVLWRCERRRPRRHLKAVQNPASDVPTCQND